MTASDTPSTPATAPSKDDVPVSTKNGDVEPPPELPENARARSYVILSFWLVVLLLGLPLWWITTAIYRAPLPLKEMQSWADGRVRDLSFSRERTHNRVVPFCSMVEATVFQYEGTGWAEQPLKVYQMLTDC